MHVHAKLVRLLAGATTAPPPTTAPSPSQPAEASTTVFQAQTHTHISPPTSPSIHANKRNDRRKASSAPMQLYIFVWKGLGIWWLSMGGPQKASIINCIFERRLYSYRGLGHDTYNAN